MQSLLVDLVADLGYLIVFLGVGLESIGLPIPGETALVIGAVAAGLGHLNPWVVAIAAWTGAVLGDNLGYYIGRQWGRRLVSLPGVRRLYDPRRLAAADRLFERWGWAAVAFGRFAALLRILAGPLAGLHRMPWRLFLVANALGAAVWVGVVTSVGVLLGSNLDRALGLVSAVGYAGLAGGVAFIGLVVVGRVIRRRRRHAHRAGLVDEPRS